MAYLKTIAILCLFLYAYGITVSANDQERRLPTLGAPVMIASDGGAGCASNKDRQDALRSLKSMVESILQNFSFNPNCGPGLWRPVFYLSTSSQNQSCPGDWNIGTEMSVSGCIGANVSCQSAYSDEISCEYSKVCGRVIGIGTTSPDGFHRFISNQTTIEDNYLDGVSVTHGAPGSRTHIWSFGAGHAPTHIEFSCPCDDGSAPLPPSEVGENYFCSRFTAGLLWSGSDCTSDNPCCSFHNPPYFSVQLPSPTTDQIELRICSDQHVGDEYVLVQFAEIYVQ